MYISSLRILIVPGKRLDQNGQNFHFGKIHTLMSWKPVELLWYIICQLRVCLCTIQPHCTWHSCNIQRFVASSVKWPIF